MKKLWFVTALLALMLLAGCGRQNQIETPVYTVTFTMAGQVCSQQRVLQGHLPRSVLTNLPGLEFVQWCNEDGQPVNPYTIYVGKDITYVAEAYPELTNHAPFLFLDADGYLRPDALLTADELSQALHALATDEAAAYFPGMPAGDMHVSREVLLKILESFFPADLLPQLGEQDPREPVTRTEFAQILCKLLNRGEMETISMDRSVVLAKDITRNREDAIVLMEASMTHTPNTQEHTWSQVTLPVVYEPGFVNVDGWLYYVKADYLFLKNGDVGSFRFDAQGRYTSGNQLLDETVAKILGELIQTNPTANRRTLLRLAFDYCSTYAPMNKSSMALGQTGWEVEEALTMLLDGKGDCYNYAAAFWALARGLGYDAQCVSGTRGADEISHGWVMITFEGQEYIFDPERQNTIPWGDWFMMNTENNDQWLYRW